MTVVRVELPGRGRPLMLLLLGVLGVVVLLLAQVLPVGALPQVHFVRCELTDAVGVPHRPGAAFVFSTSFVL